MDGVDQDAVLLPRIMKLFEDHSRILESDDETDNPFYKEIESLTKRHCDIAINAIEKCVFDTKYANHDSTYNAIYFCGRMLDEEGSAKCKRILERTLFKHGNSIARLYACEALGDAGKTGALEAALEREENKSVRRMITKYVNGEARSIT